MERDWTSTTYIRDVDGSHEHIHISFGNIFVAHRFTRLNDATFPLY